MSNKSPHKMSISGSNWRNQLVVAFALMTIIPLLTFGYFLSSYLMPNMVTRESIGLVVVLNLLLSGTGYFVIFRILRSLAKFREYIQRVAEGDLDQTLTGLNGADLDSISQSVEVIVRKLSKDRDRLTKLSGKLEKKVDDRMFELGRTNEILERELEERKKAEDELDISRKQLRALAARLESVREKERTRIAREIHDELGHILTGLKIDLSWIGKRIVSADDEEIRQKFAEKIASVNKSLDDTIQTVRRIATQLRPELLDHLGLGAALEWEVSEFEKRTNIKCSFSMANDSDVLSHDQSTGLFRIFQEILTNVTRHAKASKVLVTIKQDSGYLILEVEDNGVGVDEQKIRDARSLGILGMRERARLLGGEFALKGEEGKGTTVTVKIPV